MTSQEATEEADLPRRSRRESAKPAKKKKKFHLKGFLVTVLVLLILLGAGGFFGLRYAESALQPVDPSSKQYMTVQIPDGSNAQENWFKRWKNLVSLKTVWSLHFMSSIKTIMN